MVRHEYLAFAASLVTIATADPGYVAPLPENGYWGNLNSQITCQTLGVNVTFQGEFSAMGPLDVQSGQQFLANDVAFNLTLPAVLTAGASLIGAKSVSTFVHIDILSDNLTPTDYNVFPQGKWFNGSKIAASGDSTISVPSSGVLSGFGPFTAGNPGLGTVYLGNVKVEVYLIGSNGNVVAGPIEAVCSPPQYNAILATFNVIEKYEDNPPLLDVKNGYLISFPPIQKNTQFGCFQFKYDCAIGPYYPLTFDVSACGVVAGIYDYGETFNINNISSRLTIPAALAQSIPTLYPGTTNFDFNAESLDFELTNTNPSSMNGIPAGGSNQNIVLPSNGDVAFHMPPNDYLNVGPFVVNGTVGNGSAVQFILGNTTANVMFYDSSHNTVGSAAVSCQPHNKPLNFIGVTIAPPLSQSFGGLTGI